MKVEVLCTVLHIVLIFDQIFTASAIEKGIIYGVRDPSSLSNLPKIPENDNGFKYLTYYLNGRIRSIATDSKRKVAFIATSFQIQAIHNYSLLKSDLYELSTEFYGKSDDTGEIVFDYLSNNLYWCDSRLNWVAMKPAYNGNASFYRVVVQDNLNRPEGLALDPVDGIMFFSDNYPNGRIRKASLNGDNSTVIVFNGLVHVPSLSIDTENKKLYWVDIVKDTAEVCDYDGSNRRVIVRYNMSPMSGIQFYKNVLHLVCEKNGLVRGIDAFSGVISYNVALNSGIPTALAIFDTENLPNLPDPCSSKQCGQICVNTPSGPTCLCHDGYDLAEDDRSCTEQPLMYRKGIVISTHNEFELVNIASINNVSTASQSFKDSTANITSFAVDAVKAKIYYIDKNNDALKEMDLITQQISVLTNMRSGKELIIDWNQELLGWINDDSTEILSFNLESGNTSSIYSELEYAESLTVNPEEGKLYWISGMPSIMSGNWNGDLPVPLVTSEELTFPRTMNYDVTNNRLYWSDGELIKSCLSNGSDVQTHNLVIEAAYAFSYKDFYIWVLKEHLYFGLKDMTTHQTLLPVQEDTTDVALFDPYLQNNLTGTCQRFNGGCEEICVPQQEDCRCECDLGLQLQNDSRTCNSSVFESNFVLVTDKTHDRILQVSLETGELNKIPINATGASGITFDKSTQTVFFTSSKYLFSSKVMSVPLHGEHKIKTYATGFRYSESVAIDHSTGNIYFAAVTSPEPDSIRVLSQETLEQKTLLTSIQGPRSIALYSSKGFIFWTELGTQRIGRAHMDGTSIQYIVTVNAFWPNGVAIDFTAERLYWIEGVYDYIETSDLNGGDRKAIAVDTFSHMRSIFVHGDYVYYTGFKRQRVLKIHKTTGARVPFMENYPELGILSGIFVSMENDTLDVHPLCAENNGLCSTFCLPIPTGRTCGCPDNVELLPDQKTCKGVPVCPSSFSNLQLLNCPPYLGKSCEFECNPGFRKVANSSVRCNALGQWEPDIDTLCIDILCPFLESNAVLKSDCTRKVGLSCGFICKEQYVTSYSGDIVCDEDGKWNLPMENLCTSTKTHEASKTLIVGLSSAVGVVVLITTLSCVYHFYWRNKKNQKTQTIQKIQQINTVQLTNMDRETDIFPNREENRPLSEGYSSLYEESDYGYTWFEDVFDPVNINTGSIGGDIISGGYIDPASEGENMMGSDDNNLRVLTSDSKHIRDRVANTYTTQVSPILKTVDRN